MRIGRPRFEREGLIGEIGLVLLGICTILIGLTAVFSVGMQRQQEVRSARTYGKEICGVLAGAAAEPLARGDQETLGELVRSLAARQSLLYASVSDVAGQIVAETDRADFSGRLPRADLSSQTARGRARVIQDEDREYVSISAPVFSAGQRVGTAQIVVAGTASPVQTQQLSRYVAIVALVAFLLVGATYGYLRRVLRPLPRLIRELTVQVEDKTIRPIEVRSRGQLHDLVAAWNNAVRVFRERIDAFDRKNTQLEIEAHVLEYEKKRVESIVGLLPIGVIVTNSSGRIAMANRAAQSLTGRSREDLLGQTPGHALGQASLDETLHQSRSSRAFELSLAGSEERIVKVTVSDLTTPGQQQPAGSLITLREITQQKMADRMTHEFVNHVAHEFRTPLSSIRAYTEMLVDDQVDDENTRSEFYNTIAQETERLTRLIEDMLNISKMEAGSLTLHRGPVRVDRLLGEVVDALRPQAEANGLRLSVELPEPAPPMDLDKNLISVALVNLAGNALKYTPPGGAVTITAKVAESHLAIRVRDTGLGIREEDLLHIFDKFYRSPDESIQKQPGTGLGLALAQQVAYLHGGEITVTSVPGEGSEFCLTLPLAVGKQIPTEIGAES